MQPSLSFSKHTCRTLRDRQERALVFAVRPQSQEPAWSGDTETRSCRPAASVASGEMEVESSLLSITCREQMQGFTPAIQAVRGRQPF